MPATTMARRLICAALAVAAVTAHPATGSGSAGKPQPCGAKGGCPDDIPALCQPASLKPDWPLFHLMDNVTKLRGGSLAVEGLNDVNAIFLHRGLYHVMNQAGGGDWTNAVSSDLVHWYHLKHALDAGHNGGHNWGGPCDGSLSFPDLGVEPYNGSTPVIMYGPDCRCTRSRGCVINGTNATQPPPQPQQLHASHPMDAARIEVALPVDPAGDPYLANWVKTTPGPVTWQGGSLPCSFPGRVWKSKSGKYWNQVCALNGSHPWARFTSTDPALMHWKQADNGFLVGIPATDSLVGACDGASLFHKIPGSEHGGPTHMISANSGSQFYVGTYDADTELMTVVGQRQTLDYSSNYQWAAAGTNGPDPEADNGRLLTVAWCDLHCFTSFVRLFSLRLFYKDVATVLGLFYAQG